MDTAGPGYNRFRTGPVAPTYNEAAFKHFLSIDRWRARQAGRPLYLVLVAVRSGRGQRAALSDATAAALFKGLCATVREVDFVGWYKEGRVAAAVLAQSANAPKDVAPAIAGRVMPALQKQLPGSRSSDVRVRVVRLGGTVAR